MLPESVVQDIRHSLRLLGRQRGFAFTAILTLALSTGAAAAILSVIHSTLLQPLPYPEPDRLVTIGVNTTISGQLRAGLAPSLDDVRAWSAPDGALTRVAVRRTVFPLRVFDAGAPERVESMNVTEQYLSLFGVSPIAGRDFTSDDTRPGAPGAILLSYGFWMSRFAGDRAVIGRTVRFDDESMTIVGVLPPAFGQKIPVWRALQMPAAFQGRRGTGWTVIGRLAPGVTREVATARLPAGLPPDSRGQLAEGVRVRSMLDEARGDYRTTVIVLTSAVSLIVLIACVNVAGLLLAKGASRRAELAVRAAMGASRGRILAQLLTESLLLSAIGGLAGVGLAWLTLHAIVLNLPIDLPGDAPARISGFVLASTMGVAMLNGLLFGVLPALRLSRTSGSLTMARAGRQQAAELSRRGGQGLMAVEIALALVMLAGAGLMIRSFIRLSSVDLGFDPATYLTLKVQPLDQKASPAAQFYPALLERIRQLPGVEAAGAIDTAPLADGLSMTAVRRVGGEFEDMIQVQKAFPGYFEAVGLQARQGRILRDLDSSGPEVIVINEKAAKLFFPKGSAIGERLQVGAETWFEVIGVVPDTLHSGPRGGSSPAIYQVVRPTPEPQPGMFGFTVIVRPRAGASDLGNALKQAAESVGPPVIFDGVRRGTDWLGERVELPRQRTVLLGLLGGLGWLLALVGVLGMTSYAVGRRTQEIGIRLALGAQPNQVVRGVLLDSARPILIGVLVGTGAALLSTKVIQTFLFKTSPTDAVTLSLTAGVLFIAGCLAAWIPARRAATVDPVTALRSE